MLRALVLLLEPGQAHHERPDGPGNLYGLTVKARLEKLESERLVKRWADDTI